MVKFLRSAGPLLMVLAFLVAGCSKSSSPTGPAAKPPDLTAPTFKGPDLTSASADTSYGAQFAGQLAATFNAVATGYTGIFAQAGSPSQSGSTWTWTINGGAYTITFTATQSDTTYKWKYVVDGTYNGFAYSKWTAFEGSETASGANGDWTLYNNGTTTPLSTVSWSTNSNGNLTGTIIGYDTTGAETDKYVFVNNKDNSGELEEYANGSTLIMKVTWTSSGTGAWSEYDDKGNLIGSGTWS